MSEKMESRIVKIEDKLNKVLEKLKVIVDLNQNMQVLNEKVDKMSNLEKNLDVVQTSLQHFNGLFETLKKSFDESVKDTAKMKKNLEVVMDENSRLKKEVRELRVTTADLQNAAASQDLEIVGFPHSSGENLRNILKNIGQKISVKFEEKDVTKVVRESNTKLNVNTNKTRVGNIRVTFVSSEKRNEFLGSGKRARLRGQDLGFVGVQIPIYFNEILTSFEKGLLFKARQFKMENSWKYVWVKDSKIFLRKEDKSPVCRIIDESDILKLGK